LEMEFHTPEESDPLDCRGAGETMPSADTGFELRFFVVLAVLFCGAFAGGLAAAIGGACAPFVIYTVLSLWSEPDFRALEHEMLTMGLSIGLSVFVGLFLPLIFMYPLNRALVDRAIKRTLVLGIGLVLFVLFVGIARNLP
jgi:hypothetical protein